MLETELKSICDDWSRRCAAVAAAGGTLSFQGELVDQRFDTPARELAGRDEVLRVRVYRDDRGERAELHWKGPTRQFAGFKQREELGSGVGSASALEAILQRLGYERTTVIERTIQQYDLGGAVVRFERYPCLDDLVEVEGTPEQIERAIDAVGLPRQGFTSDRLADFVRRYEARTGTRAVLVRPRPGSATPPDSSDG